MTQAIPRRFFSLWRFATPHYHPHALLPGCLLIFMPLLVSIGYPTPSFYSAASRTLAGAVLNFLFASLYIPLFLFPRSRRSRFPWFFYIYFASPAAIIQSNHTPYRIPHMFFCSATLLLSQGWSMLGWLGASRTSYSLTERRAVVILRELIGFFACVVFV
jgi:hypothetical protein